jgi:transcriptional regulator with XRE-family HTH domain
MHEYVEKLGQIKDEKKLTIQQLAQSLDMAEQYVAMILLGEIVPRETDLERISEFVLENI